MAKGENFPFNDRFWKRKTKYIYFLGRLSEILLTNPSNISSLISHTLSNDNYTDKEYDNDEKVKELEKGVCGEFSSLHGNFGTLRCNQTI